MFIITIKLQQLNAITVKADFDLVEPKEINFVPGQFISLSVGNGLFRSYSICSDHKEKNKMSIVLTVAHNGAGSNYVKTLKQGDQVVFVGPSGRFTLAESLSSELLFMVTGTGIAPVISMLKKLIDTKSPAKICLYFGLKTDTNIFFADFLAECKRKLVYFNYVICVSNPTTAWKGPVGRITDFYKIYNVNAVQAYICGNPNMCTDVMKLLKDRGVSDDRIFHEKFTVSVNSN